MTSTSMDKGYLWKAFVAGSLSGCCSTILFQPLDLVKTRQQAPLVACNNTGVLQVFTTVVRKEKLAGLWKGVAPSLSRTVPGVGIYFCSLSFLRSHFKNDPTPMQTVCLGATARSVAVVQTLPITVVKTRYESGRYGYKSVADALKGIWRTEGARGLYSGLTATIVRDAPFSGLYLMFFTQSKKYLNGVTNDVPQAGITFASGVVGGILASVVTHPPDVVKTKLQIDPKSYRNTISTIAAIYKSNGISGFFRGLALRLTRRTLMAAMAWTVYEQIFRVVNLKK
ncbi:Solute carrier family 25 member 38 [Trichoplax sp. H2]|uniref:Mitochondrial glycine transporter n=1 Tax=Trichoplax adhaerens TaxID=10228 RepID=B3RQB4_TRIAD|nr:hypothetical protein TRIADDRAFT_63689 [Trichoplax adhaerens]EDV27797.1 hypothetical protein TRIADDRAFT_63689 [Trichoplax adhaerens]RDD45679.1 Solute carrier family 25 member 38 [Trichoplax sp. H2]|eukprot:XP_002109631.1 hypothetical protein TRIADDRAFT_63689 [Trichoplax adhaerens]